MSDIHVLVSPEAGRGRAAGTATEVLDRLRSLGGHVIDLSGAAAAASAAVAEPQDEPSPSGERWAASGATAGFSADVNDRANRLRRPKGQTRYTVATVLELPALKRRPTTITVDGAAHAHDAVMIAVANTAWFGGGMHICPDADPDDGLLDVTVVDGVGRIALLWFFHRVFKGTHLDHPKVHTHRGRRIEIAAEVAFWGDGEPITTGNTVLEAVPAAIRIVR